MQVYGDVYGDSVDDCVSSGCSKVFHRADKLRAHILTHTSGNLKSPPCARLPRTFPHHPPPDLLKHRSTTHPIEGRSGFLSEAAQRGKATPLGRRGALATSAGHLAAPNINRERDKCLERTPSRSENLGVDDGSEEAGESGMRTIVVVIEDRTGLGSRTDAAVE